MLTSRVYTRDTRVLPPRQTDSPSEAKHFTMIGTLGNIVDRLAPFWANSAPAATPERTKTLLFLLNIVSCVGVLPPDSEAALPCLDKRLLPALGVVCAGDPALCRAYPEVGALAVRTMIEDKTLLDLCLLAREMDVDTTHCSTKTEVIQALLSCGKPLLASPATPVAIAPPQSATTDRVALMALYNATGGPSWKNKTSWGTTATLGQWYGVTVDNEGRVTALQLESNNLTGA